MTSPAPLTALLEELTRADTRIANLAGTVRTAEEGIPSRARTVITAIETRNRIAAAVLEAIARDDQALNARLTATAIPAGDAPRLTAHLVHRDREIETLARTIDRRSREFAALARNLEAAAG